MKSPIKLNISQFCFKSGMSTMVAPISIEDFELSFGRVSIFRFKIILNKLQIIKSQSKTMLIIKILKFVCRKINKTLMNNNRIWSFFSRNFKFGQIFFLTFDFIN